MCKNAANPVAGDFAFAYHLPGMYGKAIGNAGMIGVLSAYVGVTGLRLTTNKCSYRMHMLNALGW